VTSLFRPLAACRAWSCQAATARPSRAITV